MNYKTRQLLTQRALMGAVTALVAVTIFVGIKHMFTDGVTIGRVIFIAFLVGFIFVPTLKSALTSTLPKKPYYNDNDRLL